MKKKQEMLNGIRVIIELVSPSSLIAKRVTVIGRMTGWFQYQMKQKAACANRWQRVITAGLELRATQ